MEPVEVPIRHTNLSNINCIFDIDTWLEYEEGRNNGLCPGCNHYIEKEFFGVDRHLYNALELAKRFKLREKPYKDDLIIYFPKDNIYKVLNDVNKEF